MSSIVSFFYKALTANSPSKRKIFHYDRRFKCPELRLLESERSMKDEESDGNSRIISFPIFATTFDGLSFYWRCEIGFNSDQNPTSKIRVSLVREFTQLPPVKVNVHGQLSAAGSTESIIKLDWDDLNVYQAGSKNSFCIGSDDSVDVFFRSLSPGQSVVIKLIMQIDGDHFDAIGQAEREISEFDLSMLNRELEIIRTVSVNNTNPDFTILTNDNEEAHMHKAILTERCPYFANLFSRPNDSPDSIVVPFSVTAVNVVIHSIYSGEWYLQDNCSADLYSEILQLIGRFKLVEQKNTIELQMLRMLKKWEDSMQMILFWKAAVENDLAILQNFCLTMLSRDEEVQTALFPLHLPFELISREEGIGTLTGLLHSMTVNGMRLQEEILKQGIYMGRCKLVEDHL